MTAVMLALTLAGSPVEMAHFNTIENCNKTVKVLNLYVYSLYKAKKITKNQVVIYACEERTSI